MKNQLYTGHYSCKGSPPVLNAAGRQQAGFIAVAACFIAPADKRDDRTGVRDDG